jgi:hypothetical protein
MVDQIDPGIKRKIESWTEDKQEEIPKSKEVDGIFKRTEEILRSGISDISGWREGIRISSELTAKRIFELIDQGYPPELIRNIFRAYKTP